MRYKEGKANMDIGLRIGLQGACTQDKLIIIYIVCIITDTSYKTEWVQ